MGMVHRRLAPGRSRRSRIGQAGRDLGRRHRQDRRNRVGGIGVRMKCERNGASRRCFGVDMGMGHRRLAPGRSRRSRIGQAGRDLGRRQRQDRRKRVGGIGGRMKCERPGASRWCFGVDLGMVHRRLAPGRSRTDIPDRGTLGLRHRSVLGAEPGVRLGSRPGPAGGARKTRAYRSGRRGILAWISEFRSPRNVLVQDREIGHSRRLAAPTQARFSPFVAFVAFCSKLATEGNEGNKVFARQTGSRFDERRGP
jgi:hypothetical protein